MPLSYWKGQHFMFWKSYLPDFELDFVPWSSARKKWTLIAVPPSTNSITQTSPSFKPFLLYKSFQPVDNKQRPSFQKANFTDHGVPRGSQRTITFFRSRLYFLFNSTGIAWKPKTTGSHKTVLIHQKLS